MNVKSRGRLVFRNAHFKQMFTFFKAETNNSNGAQISKHDLRTLREAAILVVMRTPFKAWRYFQLVKK